MKQVIYFSKVYEETDESVENLINEILESLQEIYHKVIDVVIPNDESFCIVYECPVKDTYPKIMCSDEQLIKKYRN